MKSGCLIANEAHSHAHNTHAANTGVTFAPIIVALFFHVKMRQPGRAHGMNSASMPECAFIHTCGLKCCATFSIAAVSGSLHAACAHYPNQGPAWLDIAAPFLNRSPPRYKWLVGHTL